MHFWIDKRSQQCGFGRSRVAASLSASSGGGVGLGFGHAPRRMHSANKSLSSTSSSSGGGNQISSIHNATRQQQQQHLHHSQQQYATNNPSTSASSSGFDQQSGSRNFHQQQQQQLINNNNFQTCTANSRNAQQQQHNQVNNNAHQQAHQQQQQQQQQQQFNNVNTCSLQLTPQPNAINNNGQSGGVLNTTVTQATLQHQHNHHHYQHDMRYHHPQFGNMSVRHYQPNSSSSCSSNAQQTTVSGGVGGDQRTNLTMPTVHSTTLSTSTVQPTILNNLNGSSSSQQSNISTPYRTNLNIVAGQAVIDQQTRTTQQQLQLLPQQVYGTLLHHDNHHGRGSSPVLQHHQQQQPAMRQSLNYQISSPRTHLGGVQCGRTSALQTSSGVPNLLVNANANIASNIENRSGSPAIFTNDGNAYQHHHYHQQQQQQQQQQHLQQQHQQQQHAHHRQLHALIDPAETQLLPSHLKSGVCASLVLASVFVAAAKFYFDHQNSGLEVLIFIAFSMTFLLAACTVSLCRIPKGIIVQRPSSMHGGDHATRGAYSAAGADGGGGGGGSSVAIGMAGVIGGGGVGGHVGHGGSAGGVMLNRTGGDHVGGLNSTCQQLLYARPLMQEHHALAAQAGPPPYHIAILLPENGCKDEEESPPPSYDKILI